jgi:hypothetical protein
VRFSVKQGIISYKYESLDNGVSHPSPNPHPNAA